VNLGIEPDKRPTQADSSGPVKRDSNEAVFQGRVVKLAEQAGYTVYHTRDSRRSAAGFQDLVIFKDDDPVCHMWELKRRGGQPSAEQCHFLAGMDGKVIDCRLYHPDDMDEIVDTLDKDTRK